jgi:hypothetical protein
MPKPKKMSFPSMITLERESGGYWKMFKLYTRHRKKFNLDDSKVIFRFVN